MSDRIRVLHVDDEPDFVDLSASYLERENSRLTVETATSPDDGLDQLSDELDCIISDYDMPGMNGIEFLEAVRTEYPDLPFILFTGKGSESVAGDAISAGITDYLQKETGVEQYTVLANRAQNAVSQYRAQRRAAQRKRDLTHERDRLAAAFDAVPHPLVHVRIDDEPIVLRVNDAFEAVFGLDRTAVRGTSLDDQIVPESDADCSRDINELARSGQRVEREVVRETVDGERTFIFTNAMVTNEEGPTEGIGTYVDISEHKAHERERK